MHRNGGRARGGARVEDLALAFVALCGELEREILRNAWALNGQLQRTSASVLSNVGEGLDAGTAGEKRRFFGYALRAAGEAERLLMAARERGALTAPQYTRGMSLLRDIKMDLRRLIAWTRRQ